MGQTANSESCSFCKVWVLRTKAKNSFVLSPYKIGSKNNLQIWLRSVYSKQKCSRAYCSQRWVKTCYESVFSFFSAFFTQRSQCLPCLLQINVGLALFKRLNRLGNTNSGICQSALCFMELAQIQIGLTEN